MSATDAREPILGRWRLLRADRALDFAPGVRMDFQPGGRLLYAFDAGGHRYELALVYRVEGDQLHTESPATTHETTARVAFGEGGALILDFAGARAWFVPEL
ncbi:MAG TPA: hypothetical protein VFV33_11575 [Gemmatimonadaceae bacterium]|nr:hypothetical protein [Gemmatimonadaceae bacterium]